MTPSRYRLVIGWLEVLGASLGALLAYQTAPQLAAVMLPLAVAFVLFFTLIGLAGVLLVRNHTWGLPLSLLVRGMQIPVFLSPGPSYYANAGLCLRLTVDSHAAFGFYFFLGTQLHYSWESDRIATTVGFNLVAAIVLYLLVTRVEEAKSGSVRREPNGAA